MDFHTGCRDLAIEEAKKVDVVRACAIRLLLLNDGLSRNEIARRLSLPRKESDQWVQRAISLGYAKDSSGVVRSTNL